MVSVLSAARHHCKNQQGPAFILKPTLVHMEHRNTIDANDLYKTTISMSNFSQSCGIRLAFEEMKMVLCFNDLSAIFLADMAFFKNCLYFRDSTFDGFTGVTVKLRMVVVAFTMRVTLKLKFSCSSFVTMAVPSSSIRFVRRRR